MWIIKGSLETILQVFQTGILRDFLQVFQTWILRGYFMLHIHPRIFLKDHKHGYSKSTESPSFPNYMRGFSKSKTTESSTFPDYMRGFSKASKRTSFYLLKGLITWIIKCYYEFILQVSQRTKNVVSIRANKRPLCKIPKRGFKEATKVISLKYKNKIIKINKNRFFKRLIDYPSGFSIDYKSVFSKVIRRTYSISY